MTYDGSLEVGSVIEYFHASIMNIVQDCRIASVDRSASNVNMKTSV